MSRLTADAFIRQLQRLDMADAAACLRLVIDYMRPSRGRVAEDAFRSKLNALSGLLQADAELHRTLACSLNAWMQRQDLRNVLGHVGLLPRKGFLAELQRRAYDTLNPPPLEVRNLAAALRYIFHQPGDAQWLAEVSDAAWLALFDLLLGADGAKARLPMEWRPQTLDTMERLAIWVAAEELEDELVRLDPKTLSRQSPFAALQREIAGYVRDYRGYLASERSDYHDDAHIRVLLEQSHDALAHYRKRSLSLGASIGLTYLLERLEQTLGRIATLLDTVDLMPDSPDTPRDAVMRLFRELVTASTQHNSVRALWKQNIGLLSRKVSNNASAHGEHYATSDRHGYLKMLGSAAGAGLIIPFMAIAKIRYESLGLPLLFQTLLICLNYGLGFVIIHMLGFSVATKQPAMTAAHISNAMERDSKSRAKPAALIELVASVSRTQFIAIFGNVSVALAIAIAIAWGWQTISGNPLVSPHKATYLLNTLTPVLSLWYAAIAGIWLFCSGLIAGYFDNRFDLLGLGERFIHHPLWRRLLPERWRHSIARYLGEHYGALWGNFLFGVLLGLSGLLGILTGLPIDIRHVTFSAANLGFAGAPGVMEFLVYLGFVLMIGAINLAVSFSLALAVALRARGLRIDNPWGILRALWGKLLVAPWEFFLPPARSKRAKIEPPSPPAGSDN